MLRDESPGPISATVNITAARSSSTRATVPAVKELPAFEVLLVNAATELVYDALRIFLEVATEYPPSLVTPWIRSNDPAGTGPFREQGRRRLRRHLGV